MTRKLVLVLSTIFDRGGIPRFNQMLCLALDQLSAELDLDITTFSQDDRLSNYEEHGAPWKRMRFVPGHGQRGMTIRALSHCARERPDLMIIGHLGMTPVGLACSPFLRRGFCFIAHGVEAWNEPRLSRRFSARRARFALAVSADTGQALVRATGLGAERVRILANTLSPSFELPSEEPPGENGLVLLTVSRLWAEEHAKGVDRTIEAFARVAPRHPTARYTIVGKGSDKPRLVALVGSLGLADRITFLENLSDDELAAAYRRCSVFVLPSGQEGFGIVFLEAMRFAKPCIGGDAGGTPEVVAHGETGLLVPFGDVDALVCALDRLLADPELRRRMGQAGLSRLLRDFSFDGFRARVRQHVLEFLGTPGPPAPT